MVATAYPGPNETATNEAASNVLIGASTVAAMTRFAEKGEFDNYTDADIPFSDIEMAIAAVGELLASVSARCGHKSV